MLNEIVSSLVDESLDFFFPRLREHYDHRRQLLLDSNPHSSTAIDYILNLKYPPESAAKWIACYKGLSRQKSLNKLLIIYLTLDMESLLGHKNAGASASVKQLKDLKNTHQILSQIPFNHDFHISIIELAQGLWAVDNGEPRMTVCSLSNPSVKLSDYFDDDDDVDNLLRIITESLINSNQNSMALFMNRLNRPDTNAGGRDMCATTKTKGYDRLYAYLLVTSGQLIEALKYIRSLRPGKDLENQDPVYQHETDNQREDYMNILHEFVELCAQWNATKSLNYLNLMEEEETVLNQHFESESRPITPVSTNSQTPRPTKSTTKSTPKPRNRNIQVVRRVPSFNDSPARNTRSARKKTVK